MKFNRTSFFLFLILCQVSVSESKAQPTTSADFKLIVLGISQDGSYPQVSCQKNCCKAYSDGVSERHFVSSMAIFQTSTKKVWLIDCTPDFPDQMRLLEGIAGSNRLEIEGIFLSHAHMGHYLGLAELGREVMGAKNIPVYCMPRMASFLQDNGPWDQLIKLQNIEISPLKENEKLAISPDISIIPFMVPHRDEYSETIGFRINGPSKSVLFIPDIDKWEKWSKIIEEEIETVDLAFIDGTFYDAQELPGRNMSEIPHPFVLESMKRFEPLDEDEKSKVHFIHFNHSNPLHFNTEVINFVRTSGFNIATQGQIVDL